MNIYRCCYLYHCTLGVHEYSARSPAEAARLHAEYRTNYYLDAGGDDQDVCVIDKDGERRSFVSYVFIVQNSFIVSVQEVDS